MTPNLSTDDCVPAHNECNHSVNETVEIIIDTDSSERMVNESVNDTSIGLKKRKTTIGIDNDSP